MRHFSCDLCGKTLAEADERFVLRMELSPVMPMPNIEDGRDVDHLETLAEWLDKLEADMTPPMAHPQPKEYDLCPRCQASFIADPLGRARAHAVRFSAN